MIQFFVIQLIGLLQKLNLPDCSTLDTLVETVLKKDTALATLQTSGTNGRLSELSAVSNSTSSLESHE